MVSNCKLSKHGADIFFNPTLYRSIVGALQCATLTRPEISFAVNKVYQFMENPLDSHWDVVKRILRYLKGKLYYGLHFQSTPLPSPVSLTIYDRHKQQVIARSSTEAEYKSLAQTSAELTFLNFLQN
ncbi:uncharacterized mitochondrial protein AtMg00810-like [Vigna angularis]|uniref:uncharacterized mitochondrial protein AtMg00810-like n=1 Tax=Phaseolus angularis TaxID=3914 RepID=UPI00080A0029|nr:uncharacterized mitochondrial protein AtMg00810-like [Vigna angularis]